MNKCRNRSSLIDPVSQFPQRKKKRRLRTLLHPRHSVDAIDAVPEQTSAVRNLAAARVAHK